MSRATLIHKTGKINAYATKQEMHDFLSKLTDEDFNGNNGEDYFIEIETSTGPKLISRLESCMRNYDVEKSIKEKMNFISSVIEANYSSDSYYKDYDISIDNINDHIVVSIAILEN